MVRVTVEDCVEKINDRFTLVMVAARRARQLALAPEKYPHSRAFVENDKPTTQALRELSFGDIDESILEEREEIALSSNRMLSPIDAVTEPASAQDNNVAWEPSF